MDTTPTHGRVLLLGGVALLLGIIGTALFFDHGLGLNYPLFVLLASCGGFLLTRVFSRKVTGEQYLLVALALFFAGMVYLRSSDLLTFFNMVGSFALLLLLTETFVGKKLKAFFPFDYVKSAFLPLQFIGPFFTTVIDILSLGRVKGDGGSRKRKEIIRGIIMAGVAVVVFGWLFTLADQVFAKILSDIFRFNIDDVVIARYVFGTFITAFFLGAFGFLFRKVHASPAPSGYTPMRNLGALETMILFGAINALFLLFILLQLAHLFGGTAHLLATGLTYAEYARSGFFELVVVAVLSFFIIAFAERQIVQKDNAHLRSFRILSGLLVIQVICILVSAFTRLSLYEDAYGFTTIRLYSHALMVWIGVVLLLIAQHIWTNGKREVFTFRTFSSVVLLLFVMNIVNPDAFIAKKNLERYAATGIVDANYLASLSDDALPYTIGLLGDSSEATRRKFAYSLYWKNYSRAEDIKNDWRSLRFGRAHATQLLGAHKAELELGKEFWVEDTTL